MNTIQIKSIAGDVLFEWAIEINTIATTVKEAIRRGISLSAADLSVSDLSGADLSYSNLSGADLSGADLSGANLSGADLRGANLSYSNLSASNLSASNLRGANLSDSDLRGVDLSGADLSGANLSDSFITIGQVGSRKDTTIINLTKQLVWCGCFYGTITEFESKVKDTHKDNPQYLKEYTGAIAYVKSLMKGEKK